MRTIRALTTAVAFVAALPSVMVAQQGRQFKDAWFWGVKGGGFTFADSAGSYTVAPAVGAEWLITRTHAGLYVGFSEAFMTTQTLFASNPAAPDTSLRTIELQNMRKLDAMLLGFPGNWIRAHPYVGIGFTLSQIADTDPLGTFNSMAELEATQAQILNTKVGFSPVVMVGLQYRLSPVSVFGHAMLSPAQKNFILYNGRPVYGTIELGLRYNVGSAISKDY
jgi:hypothetical protein